MTTIAYKDGVLAGDRRVTYEGITRTTTKVHRVNKDLVGFTGHGWQAEELLEWYRMGAEPDKFPGSNRNRDEWTQMLVIRRRDGEIEILSYERSPFPVRLLDPFVAAGSGRDFAMTAMHLGKTAAEAVEVASLFDAFSGNGIDTLTLEGP